MSETQNYKTVNFSTSDTLTAAAAALDHYRRYVQRQIDTVPTSHGLTYWTARLSQIESALVELFA